MTFVEIERQRSDGLLGLKDDAQTHRGSPNNSCRGGKNDIDEFYELKNLTSLYVIIDYSFYVSSYIIVSLPK